MNEFPAVLNLEGRTAVVVGGGPVAVRRAEALAEAHCQVRVIAPEIGPINEGIGVTGEVRPYEEGDLDDTFLVVIATDDPAVNDRVASEARAKRVLVNRADRPSEGDLVVPAHRRVGPVTVAVTTGGISPRAAGDICDAMRDSLDRDWITLLNTAEPFRAELHKAVSDPLIRQDACARLTADAAMRVLKEEGAEALAEHLRDIFKKAAEA